MAEKFPEMPWARVGSRKPALRSVGPAGWDATHWRITEKVPTEEFTGTLPTRVVAKPTKKCPRWWH